MQKNRFAFVTRWLIKNADLPRVLDPQPSELGMLNCGRSTESILSNYLSFLSKSDMIEAKSMKDLVNNCIIILGNDTVHADVAVDLKNLQILKEAIELHNAGDITGKAYKNLWFSLLVILNEKVKVLALPKILTEFLFHTCW